MASGPPLKRAAVFLDRIDRIQQDWEPATPFGSLRVSVSPWLARSSEAFSVALCISVANTHNGFSLMFLNQHGEPWSWRPI